MHSLVATLAVTVVLSTVQAQTVPVFSDVFQLQPTFRGSFPRTPCVTVFQAANGSAVVINDCTASTEQRAIQTASVPGLDKLIQLRIFNTFCFGAASDNNGALVSINSCVDGNINQNWVINAANGGQVQWGGNLKMCLDLTNGVLTNGNQLQIWECNDINPTANPNQVWRNNTLANPVSEIVNTGTGQSKICMGANSTANGAPVYATTCDDATSRKVWFNPQPGHGNSGSYKLAFGPDGTAPFKCLDVTNGVNAPGTKLQLWDCVENANQQWLPSGVNIRWDGIAQNFPMCVDLTDGKTTIGNQLQIWNCTAGPNQDWAPIAPPQTAI